MGLFLKLVLDVICWTGLTSALLWFGHPNFAAAVGAFGIVYLYRATQSFVICLQHANFLNELEGISDYEWCSCDNIDDLLVDGKWSGDAWYEDMLAVVKIADEIDELHDALSILDDE